MGQIRFQVGMPKAGSAARSAEQEPRMRSLSSLAGSAARAAEEAKRNETPGAARMPSISMRAAGGKVFQPPVPAAESPVPVASVETTTASAAEQSPQVSATTPAEDSTTHGVLQTAVSRIQSLVQALFPGPTRTP